MKYLNYMIYILRFAQIQKNMSDKELVENVRFINPEFDGEIWKEMYTKYTHHGYIEDIAMFLGISFLKLYALSKGMRDGKQLIAKRCRDCDDIEFLCFDKDTIKALKHNPIIKATIENNEYFETSC